MTCRLKKMTQGICRHNRSEDTRPLHHLTGNFCSSPSKRLAYRRFHHLSLHLYNFRITQSSKAHIRTSLGTLTHKITALAKADMQIQHPVSYAPAHRPDASYKRVISIFDGGSHRIIAIC